MSCPYYWWNYHYACRKSGKDVNEDIYGKYCQGYDYDDCPIYKGNDSSGCFLTSACVESMALPDDCHELTVLRSFRDTYLTAQPGGPQEICEYYHIAPKIVAKINALPNAREVWMRLYQELILPCVRWIEEGNNRQAHSAYRSAVEQLKNIYC